MSSNRWIIASIIVMAAGTATVTGWRALSKRDSLTDPGAFNEPGPVLAAMRLLSEPLPVPIIPCNPGELVPLAEVKKIANVAAPRFSLRKLHVPIVFHALRCWGPHAFGQGEAAQDHSLVSGESLVDILFNHEAYKKLSQYELSALLRKSDFGVRVVALNDMALISMWGESHVGELISVTAECGIESSRGMRLSDGSTATLADVIRDTAMRVTDNAELEWLAIGLSRYLSTPTWQNRFGEEMSLSRLAEILCHRPLGLGACVGTHVPLALATLLSVHNQTGALTPTVAAMVAGRLEEHAKALTASQSEDGSWPQAWYRPTSANRVPAPSTWGNAALDRLSTTGHHLEWMMITPRELRPGDEVIRRAILYLRREIPRSADVLSASSTKWTAYLPMSHAVHGFVVANGFAFAPIVANADLSY